MYVNIFDLVTYSSKQLSDAIETEAVNATLKVCERLGFHIDERELLKLLTNDREKYDKGFQDGVVFAQKAKEEALKHLQLGIAMLGENVNGLTE